MVAARNPFVGLRPFGRDERLLFCGRDTQIGELILKLRDTRFVAVVGSSGSGKSSLVKAGLLPALEGGFLVGDRELWRLCVMQPGDRPLRRLAGALTSKPEDAEALVAELWKHGARAVVDAAAEHTSTPIRLESQENFLLIVDQFEELFRYRTGVTDGEQRNEAHRFVQVLLGLAERENLPAYVVITMRSDFIGDCAAFQGLPEALNRSQYLVPRLTRQQLRQAIEAPARMAGAEISNRLVERLLLETDGDPDQLPLLQHVLMRTWDRWREDVRSATPVGTEEAQRPPISEEHYEKVGGIAHALSWHADEAMENLSEEDRALTERVFLTLTQTDEANRQIRRPANISTICSVAQAPAAAVWNVIDRFRSEGRTFLVMSGETDTDDPKIDITHESLIRRWDHLKTWVEAEAESAGTYRRLAQTAVMYRRGDAPLLRDPELQLAVNWHRSQRPSAAWAHQYCPDIELGEVLRFVGSSLRTARALEAASKAEASRQRMNLEELARVRQEALQQREAQLAQANETARIREQKLRQTQRFSYALAAFTAVSLVALFLIYLYNEKSGQLNSLRYQFFIDKVRSLPPDQPVAALTALHLLERQEQLGEEADALVSDGIIRTVARVAAGTPLWRIGATTALAVSSKGLIVAAIRHRGIQVWEPTIDKPREQYNDFQDVLTLDVSRRDGLLAVGEQSGQVSLLALPDTSSGKTGVHRLRSDAAAMPVATVTFSPDGRWLAARYADGSAYLWAVDHAENKALQLTADTTSSTLSPVRSGASGGVQKSVPAQGPATRPSRIVAVRFDPRGDWLATATDEGAISIWRTADVPKPECSQCFPELNVTALTFSRDGALLLGDVSGGIWRSPVATRRLSLRPEFQLDGPIVTTLFAAANANIVLAGSLEGDLYVWIPGNHVQAGPTTISLRDEAGNALQELKVISGTISADGHWVVLTGENGVVKLWDLEVARSLQSSRFRPVPELRAIALGHEAPVNNVAFDPDLHWLATAEVSGVPRLWNLRSPKPGDTTVQHSGPINGLTAMSVSPDLSTLILARMGEAIPTMCPLSDPSQGGLHHDHGTVTTNAPQGISPLQFIKSVKASSNGSWIGAQSAVSNAAPDASGQLLLYSKSTATLQQTPFALQVTSFEFSGDGAVLVTGEPSGLVRVWPLSPRGASEAGPTLTVSSNKEAVRSLTVSHTGGRIAAATERAATLGTLGSNQRITQTCDAVMRGITAIAVDPQERWFAVAGYDDERVPQLWVCDIKTGLVDMRLHGQQLLGTEVTGVTFTRNHDWVIVQGADSRIRIFEVDSSAKSLEQVVGFQSSDSVMRVSPDGHWLLSAGRDGRARLWDLNRLDKLAPDQRQTMGHRVLPGTGAPIVDAVFTNDVVMTQATDGTVQRWDLDVKALVQGIRAAVGRNLTCAEWARLFPFQSYRKTIDQLPDPPDPEACRASSASVSWFDWLTGSAQASAR